MEIFNLRLGRNIREGFSEEVTFKMRLETPGQRSGGESDTGRGKQQVQRF